MLSHLLRQLKNTNTFYYDQGFDMHKDAVSLSGLAEKIMFKISHAKKDENISFTESEITDEKGVLKKEKVYDNQFYLINDENKECFYKLKKNNTGGPSIVFHRYHEQDKTKISRVKYVGNSKYEKIEGGKMVKKIVGFDANALYLWSLSQYMPTGLLQYKQVENQNIKELLKTTYGFYEVDISVPENLYDKFSEFPPIFKNAIINGKERKLISCLSAQKILL